MSEFGDEVAVFLVDGMASQNSDVHISDVIEVIETDGMFGPSEPANVDKRRPHAHVKILEQPAGKALRFRYECEGRSAGSIPGVSSTPENKTFPTIQIIGYQGRAVVVVSCVTKDSPYRPHPHNLVGKEGCSRGVCTLKMNSDTISFSNLGIQCVKKKDIEEALKIREEIRVDPFRTGFLHRNQPSNIDLNSVRLCFQVFLEGPKKDEFTVPLRPVVSEPIYDKKAMSDLTICKLSDCSASVAGGREIILLCEKVAKEDIQVRFYEEVDGDVTWEAQGDFPPTHVHKQVAISFRTPKYRDLETDRPVKVWVQLRRPSDGTTSESVPFLLTPLDSDIVFAKRKRPKMGGEASPQNIFNPTPDDDTRSTYVGSISPDRLQLLHVKREPPESSPVHLPYAGGLSPMYAGASPGRGPSPSTIPSPIPYAVYSNYPPQQHHLNVRLPDGSGGGLVELNPFVEQNNLNYQGNFGKTLPAKMDAVAGEEIASGPGPMSGLDLHYLDSGELTRMAMMTEANLAEDLSRDLTLSDDPNRQQDHAMTDSFTRVANKELLELVSMGNRSFGPNSQPN